jgi:hypothetical protein
MESNPDINNQESETYRKKDPLYRPHTTSTLGIVHQHPIRPCSKNRQQKNAKQYVFASTIISLAGAPCVLVKPLSQESPDTTHTKRRVPWDMSLQRRDQCVLWRITNS